MALSHSKLFASSTAMAIILSNAAYADVSAEDVWANLQDISGLYGRTLIAGSKSYAGGKMVLSDVSVSAKVEGAEREGSIEMIELQERGDGTVSITLSPEITLDISSATDTGEDFEAEVSILLSGQNLVASGDPDNMTLDYSADKVAVSVENLEVDSDALPAQIEIVASGLKGKSTFEDGELIKIENQHSSDGLDMTVDMDYAEDGEQFNLDVKGSATAMTSTSVSVYPKGMDLSDPAVMFNPDVSISGTSTFGPVNVDVDFMDGSDTFKLVASSAKSAIDIAIQDGSIRYGWNAFDTKFSVDGSQIPLPDVSFGASENAFDVMFPMAKSDEPKDFKFLTTLIDLEISDSLWSMIDAGGALPHDPATLIIDLAGKANWMVDILDPEQAAAMSDEMPVELHALTVNELKLKAIGAEVNGTGDFTFDNTDLTSFDGMPAPTGKLNLNLFGINSLLDNLAAAGLLPQDQSMGARMMLGLFARPGEGEDTLTSEIEFKDNGSIFANGQQLK